MGKSTCAGLFARAGLPVVDTDDLARQLTEPGTPALSEISDVFGKRVVASDGGLNRRELAQIVFADSAARMRLEAILHPRITELWSSQAELWRSTLTPAGIVVIPLLFETQAEERFDATICVACTARTQEERLKPRGWTAGEVARRISAQMPLEQKMNRSDYVLWSEGELTVLEAQVRRILSTSE
jgi:dephospho-CoA kinase